MSQLVRLEGKHTTQNAHYAMVLLLACFLTLQSWAKKCPIHPDAPPLKRTMPKYTDHFSKRGFPWGHLFSILWRSQGLTNDSQLWVIAYLNINSICVSIDKISFFSISISDCLNKIDMWQSPWSNWSSTAAEDDYQINTIFSWATSLCLFGEVSSLNHG